MRQRLTTGSDRGTAREDVGMKRLSAGLAVLLLFQAGCGSLQRPTWNKPWSYRSGVAAAVCAAIGAGAGVGIQAGRQSSATACFNNSATGERVCKSTSQSLGDSGDSTFWVWGALIGAASGFVLCGVLGHLFLDPAADPMLDTPPPVVLAEPEPIPAPPVVKQRIVLRGVQFDFNSSAIRPEAEPVLDQAATLLKQNPDVQVSVEGHTDAIGSEDYNMALSIRRAESVYRYLVNRGVDPERLTVEGFGKTRPTADNDTESGRAQNRRVELVPTQP
jgi:outer membrane protein OmpA-like peptidoglycan-associated protein